jgi:hypothetical protein
MRCHFVSVPRDQPQLFQDAINGDIEILEENDSRIVDVKFSVDVSMPESLCALILWEPKDEDKTCPGLREEHYRGRYKTW